MNAREHLRQRTPALLLPTPPGPRRPGGAYRPSTLPEDRRTMFLAFLHSLRGRARPPRPARPHGRVGLTVEPLENRLVPSAAIGGAVYHDADGNGLLDPAEQGIPGNTIELHASSGALVDSTVTGKGGRYRFAIDPRVYPAPQTPQVDS